MRLLLLAALLIGLLPAPSAADASGPGVVWDANRVPVTDHLPAWWEPYVRQAVADWNAAMPPRAPEFVYRRGAEKTCNEVGNKPPEGTIAVCLWRDASASGQTWVAYKEHVALYAKVYVAPWADQWPEQTLCHELGHAFTWMNDDYGARPDTSCVQGWLLAPGDYDRDYAREVYRRHRDRLSRRRAALDAS